MHSTPVRLLAIAFPGLAALAALMAMAACGQVTGLSDDYQYDLEGGAAADGAKSDAAATDGAASGDGAADGGKDAAPKCSSAQVVKAGQQLATYNGTQLCKTCLATGCCTDVDTCGNNTDCNKLLGCKLDCTEKPAVQRTECFKSCTSSNSVPALYTNGIGACGTSACSKECALQ